MLICVALPAVVFGGVVVARLAFYAARVQEIEARLQRHNHDSKDKKGSENLLAKVKKAMEGMRKPKKLLVEQAGLLYSLPNKPAAPSIQGPATQNTAPPAAGCARPELLTEECYVCCTEAADAVLLGCGHGGLCYNCALQSHINTGDCPLCRTRIRQIVQIAPVTHILRSGQPIVMVTGPYATVR